MLRSLLRVFRWLGSVLVRVAFVLAVVGFAATFALGGVDVSGVATGLDDTLDSVSDIELLDGGGIEAKPMTANVTPSVPSSNSTELNRTRLELLIHREVNEERIQHDRSKLAFDTELRAIARYHSADMARNNYFAHVAPDGETLGDRYRKFGYQCRVRVDMFQYATGGENILYTYYETPVVMGNETVFYSTPKELARGIVNGWMNSTPHRKNLLKPYWEREGIGVYIEQVNGRTRVYATQNFC